MVPMVRKAENSKQKRMSDALTFYGVRGALRVVDLMPVRAARRVARCMAGTAFAVARARRNIAVNNLLLTNVAKTRKGAKRIAKASFQHFADMAVDTTKNLSSLTEEALCRDVEMVAPPETLSLISRPEKGVLMLTGHFGNWEVAGQRIAVMKRSIVIAKKAKNARIQALLETRRYRPLYEVVDKHGADLRKLASAMREGAAVGMLVDQHARGATGIRMSVFGRPASVHVSPAVLYRMAEVPVVFFDALVVGPMRFRLTLTEPHHFDRSGGRVETARRVMGAYNAWLEGVVRAHPEQYLWSHRRWRDADESAAPGK